MEFGITLGRLEIKKNKNLNRQADSSVSNMRGVNGLVVIL